MRPYYGLVSLLLLAACGNSDGNNSEDRPAANSEPFATAATLGEQTVLNVANYQAMAPYQGADLANGERQAQICKACHSTEVGGASMIGPALHGFFGRRIGAHPGFAYSTAAIEADFIWTPAALDAWLAQPAAFLPGNSMSFVGVQRQEDRNDLIAYLLAVTADD